MRAHQRYKDAGWPCALNRLRARETAPHQILVAWSDDLATSGEWGRAGRDAAHGENVRSFNLNTKREARREPEGPSSVLQVREPEGPQASKRFDIEWQVQWLNDRYGRGLNGVLVPILKRRNKMKRKRFWRSKKFWGVVLTWVVSMFGHKVGMEPETCITVATGIGAATGLEALNDIIGAARRD